MKIALIILHADRSRGGAETYTVDLAAALAAAGHEVALVASSFAGEIAGVKPVSIACPGRTRTGRYRQFVDGVDFYLGGEKFDIVHAMLPIRQCHVYHPHAGLAVAETGGARLAALLNPRRIAMARIERALLEGKAPPRVLCLSQYVKEDVREYYDLDDAHLPILFNAVDVQKFTPEPRTPHDGIVGLMIAQDFERKGLAVAVEALAKIEEPRLRLRVIGKPDPSRYIKLAAKHGISDRIEFAGPTDDPATAYRAADFFVLPTKHDPCSLVVLEALASGLPVISTKFNGACEIMTDGMHGFVLPDPENVDALAEALRRMLDDATRASMSAAATELRPQLSYEHHLARLMQIYQSVVESAA